MSPCPAAKCHNSANFYPIFKKIVEALPNVELYLKIVCALPNMHNLAARARPLLWTIWAIGIRVKKGNFGLSKSLIIYQTEIGVQ